MLRTQERTLRKSQAIDLEALCVVAGKRVWSVRCDVTVTDHRGNLTDAAILAALAALRHLRLPGVAVSGSGDGAEVEVLPAERAEPQPLVFHHMPIAASLGFFRAPEGSPPLTVLDPTDREELVMLGSLVVVLNQHQELCALHKPGGLPVQPTQLLECMREAAAAVAHRRDTLEQALAVHAQQLQARAVALAKTGRMPTQRPPPGKAAVSVPVALEPPPLTSGSHFPATRLDGAKLALDGTAVPPPDAAQPFGGGASAWDAAGDEPQAALDSDEEDATVTLTSGFAPAPAPADAPPRKPNPKRRKV